jgi:hypothetical protein
VALRVNCCREVVSDDGAVSDLSEEVYDENIAGFKNVDNPGILVADAVFLFSIGANHRIHIRPKGHEYSGYNPADQPFAGINYFPPTFELIAIVGALEQVPSLLGSDVFEA